MKIKPSRAKEIIREELIKILEEEKNNPWAICTAKVGREDKEKYEDCVMGVKKQYGIEKEGQDLYNCQKDSKEEKCRNNPFGGHTGVGSGEGVIEEQIPAATTVSGTPTTSLNTGITKPDLQNLDDLARKQIIEQNYKENNFNTCGRCKFGDTPKTPTMCKYKMPFPIEPDGTCNEFVKR